MSLWWIHWYYFASWQHYTWIPCKTSPHLWFSVHLIATTDADSPHRRCGNVTNSLKESSCSSKCTTFKDFRSIYISGAFLSNCTPESHPGDTWRNNNVIITSKRRFDVMMTLLQSSRMDFTLRLPISLHKHQMIIILTNPTSDIWILRLTWQTCWRDFVKTVIMASCVRQDLIDQICRHISESHWLRLRRVDNPLPELMLIYHHRGSGSPRVFTENSPNIQWSVFENYTFEIV